MNTISGSTAAPAEMAPRQNLLERASPSTGVSTAPHSVETAVPELESANTPRISPAELQRRLWHIFPGFGPFVLWLIPHRDPISPTLRTIFIVAIVLIATKIHSQFNRIGRHGEHDFRAAVLGYSISVLGMLLLFPYQAELGLALLAILAFGDGLATLGGLLLRGPRLPWNPAKSWAGTACFVLVGLPMTAVVYWGETHNAQALEPGVSAATALVFVTPAVLASALAESVRSKLNDNLRIGITAAAFLAAAQLVSQSL